ncbi:hypothetical protein KCV04_g4006, partial [Aureobasidium melanogenum]
MGDTDIEMDGVELENPWLPYGISYPPPLPDKVMLEGQSDEQDPDWGRDAYFVGARDDLWGEGFEVRAFNPSDPLGRGKFHKDEWNVQYMLGPANPLVHWDPISMKWGLQVLEKAGFINLEADVRNNTSADPKGRFFDKRPSNWRDDLIHPVFRKDMWRNIIDSEWDALRPASLLATAFLDDPTTLCLFHALSKSSDHITFQDPNFGTCKRLQVPATLTEAEQLSTFQKICDMRQWTSFQWEDNATMAMVPVGFGRTYPLDSQASSPYTCQSKITIVRSYCEVLMQYRDKDKTRDYQKFFRSVLWEAGVPNIRRPEGLSNNLESAFLRTTFLLANHLLHEFAHAFCFAYFEIPSLGLPYYPWVGDSRDNEFGHAMERHVHGGIPWANNFEDPKRPDMGQTLRRGTYAPFGIYFAEKYSQWATPGDANKMHLVKGSEKDFKSPCVYYPLAQQQIYNYFLTKTWTENVPRYGLDAIKFTKIKHNKKRLHHTNPIQPKAAAIPLITASPAARPTPSPPLPGAPFNTSTSPHGAAAVVGKSSPLAYIVLQILLGAPVTYSVFVAVVVVVTVCTGPTSPVIVSPPEAVHHVVAVALGIYTVVYGTSGSPLHTALSAQQPM